MTKIFWAGDSTVKKNNILTYPQTGIGQALPLYLKHSVVVENHAENGRSTKSFIDESRLAVIYDQITKDDFLFIQFGHNDQKQEDPDRFTEAFGEYQENLRKFIHVAWNKQAHPVLITPLARRWFSADGVLEQSGHQEYARAMKDIAQECDVPLIDLFQMSRKQLRQAGAKNSKVWYMNLPEGLFEQYQQGLTDNTHLQYQGAVVFAGCIASSLKKLGGIYRQLLIEEFSQLK